MCLPPIRSVVLLPPAQNKEGGKIAVEKKQA